MYVMKLCQVIRILINVASVAFISVVCNIHNSGVEDNSFVTYSKFRYLGNLIDNE